MFLAPNPVRRYEHFLLAWPTNTKISVGLLFIMVKTMMAIYQACGFFSYKFRQSFYVLSSNFPEIILSCAYRASGMQQLRQGGPT